MHWRIARAGQPILWSATLAAARTSWAGCPGGPAGASDRIVRLVAEVAVTLSAVQWHAAGSLDAKQVRAEASETLQEVQRIADVTALPLNLRNYVTDTFGEIMK